MTASAYKRPFAEPKGCIGERQQPASSEHPNRPEMRLCLNQSLRRKHRRLILFEDDKQETVPI